jgi:hypothetical protein
VLTCGFELPEHGRQMGAASERGWTVCGRGRGAAPWQNLCTMTIYPFFYSSLVSSLFANFWIY